MTSTVTGQAGAMGCATIRWGHPTPGGESVQVARRALRAIGVSAAGALRTASRSVFARRAERRSVISGGLVDTVTSLGPAAMKGAQILATRRDLLPEWLCDDLGALWDRNPPGPSASALRTLRRVHGFETVDQLDLLGAGTVATVYRARRDDGTEVAVKVLHPGVAQRVRLDLHCAAVAARVLQRLPGLRGVPVSDMVARMCDGVWGQVDLVAEAAALAALRDSVADVATVHVPAPDLAVTTGELLVMEYVGPAEHGHADGVDDRLVARQILQAIFQMLFVNGLVHVDLHPGNLSVRPGGVVLFDAGFVVRLPDDLRTRFASFFFGLALGDGARCARAVVDSAVGTGPGFDATAFSADITSLVARHAGRPVGEFSLIQFARDLFAAQQRHAIFAESAFVLPLMSLLAVEGQVRALDPEVDFQAVAVPYVVTALTGLS